MVRAVVLASSSEAVWTTSQVLLASLPNFKIGVSSRWTHGASVVVEGCEGTTIQVVEVGWLSKLRSLRRAPAFGALISLRWGDDDGEPRSWLNAALEASVTDLPTPKPRHVLDLSSSSSSSSRAEGQSRLREVVLSTTGVEDSAREVERDAIGRGATSVAPGVWKLEKTSVRLQPFDSGSSALVFQCDDVDAAARRIESAELGFSRVGRSGYDPGQISLHLPWTRGLELRLCQSDMPHSHYCESHRAILDAPDVLPELQSPYLAGSHQQRPSSQSVVVEGDCWKETRATLKHQLLSSFLQGKRR